MAVDDFAWEFFRAARAEGIDLVWKPRFDWLSGLGHIEYFAQAAPPRILNRLAAIHEALGGDADLLRGKRRSRPACDFLWLERTIIELDEFQHFSTARRRSLDFYRRVRVGFDVSRYRQLCDRHHSWADHIALPRRPGTQAIEQARVLLGSNVGVDARVERSREALSL